MNLATAIFLIASPASAFVPLPAASSQAVNANFLDMAAEISRNNIRNGGTAEQTVKFSSSVQVTGSTVFSGTVKADSGVVLKSTVDVSAATMVGPQIIQAWAHFVGTGTVVILDSVGVSSITDVGTGQYRVNLSTPMSHNRYSAFVSWSRVSGAGADRFCSVNDDTDRDIYSVDVLCTNLAGTTADTNQINVGVIGRR